MLKNYAILNSKLLGKNKVARSIGLFLIVVVLARNALLKLLLFPLSYVVPKSKRILFFSSVGNYNFPIWMNEIDFQFKECPKYLAIYAAKRLDDFVSIFHVPNKKLFGQIAGLGIKPTKGLRAFWYMLRAKYLFVDNNNFLNPNASFLIGRFKIIQCWHATPFKNVHSRRRELWKRIKRIEMKKFFCALSSCNHTTEVFRKLFTNALILEVGSPRNDILFRPELFSCEDISNRFRLSNYKKVFLYAPTFRKIGETVNPFDERFLSELDRWLIKENHVLLIKQHPYADKITGLGGFTNIIDVSESSQDIQEMLICVDVLISDYSSVVFDFTLTNNPIIFFPYDRDVYKAPEGMFEDYDREMPGPFAYKPSELMALMKNVDIWSHDDAYTANYQRFKNKFNKFQDGKSCERLFKRLLCLE
jgi:CDP-glycerol glycerophosphotransferase (TagB/SpsB family)